MTDEEIAALPIGTKIKREGRYGRLVKYAPDTWARDAFDYNDAIVAYSIRDGTATIELPEEEKEAQ